MDRSPGPRPDLRRLDQSARNILAAAQADAEHRGGRVVVSGLVMLAAASSREVGPGVLRSIGTDLDQLRAAVEAEWKLRTHWLLDEPITAVRDAALAAISSTPEDTPVRVGQLLAECLRFENAMATRVIKRLGRSPGEVAQTLLET